MADGQSSENIFYIQGYHDNALWPSKPKINMSQCSFGAVKYRLETIFTLKVTVVFTFALVTPKQ